MAIPRHRLFLITVAELSLSKQLWTVSASSPFAHVLEGPPCPSAAELCWEEVAFFPFGNEAGKVRAVPLARAGSCACVFWGILVVLGGFCLVLLLSKAIAGCKEPCPPRAAALLGEILHPSGNFSVQAVSMHSRAQGAGGWLPSPLLPNWKMFQKGQGLRSCPALGVG